MENDHCEFEPDGVGWTCRVCGWRDRPHPDHPRSVPTVMNCAAKRLPSLPGERPLGPAITMAPGAGTRLHRLIKRLTGEDIEPGCGCSSHMAEMNVRGPRWCRENVAKIVDWLIEEIERRLERAKEVGKKCGWRLRVGGLKLPGRRLVLGWIVRLAVWWVKREVSFHRGRKHSPIVNLKRAA